MVGEETREDDGIELPASVIIAKIANGEPIIEYRDRIIKGNLNLDSIELSQSRHIDRSGINGFGMGLSETVREVASRLTISNCIIWDVAEFRNIYFLKEVKFDHVYFRLNADFRGAVFGDNLSFQESIFGTTAEFGNVCFQGIADFTKVLFLVKNIEFNVLCRLSLNSLNINIVS